MAWASARYQLGKVEQPIYRTFPCVTRSLSASSVRPCFHEGRNRQQLHGELRAQGAEVQRAQWRPTYRFNEAISFFISVETQQEVDYFWDRLTADGTEESFVWLAQGWTANTVLHD
jgi:uncharacterized glyoxalase superfamily protein PhnB